MKERCFEQELGRAVVVACSWDRPCSYSWLDFESCPYFAGRPLDFGQVVASSCS